MSNGGATGMLVVVTGASHVTYGSRGTGLPARISRKLPTKNHVVILLDAEGQYIRREGEVPLADFLWCSTARPCSRNCFDCAEIARLMNAAGRRRDALPQTRNATGLVVPAIAASLGALTHTLGTLVPVIGASGFATVATATVIGTVVSSFR